MDNTKGSRKQRSSTSPLPSTHKDEVNDETNVEIEDVLEDIAKSCSEDPTVSRESQLLLMLRQKTREKNTFKRKYIEWKNRADSLEKKLHIAEAELDLRPHIEVLQRKAIPIWLLNSEYESAFMKWVLSLEFQLTQAAKIILSRLVTFQCPVNILEAADTLVLMYDALSETMQHNRTPCPIRLNEDEWKALFDKIKVYDPETQSKFKEIVKPITKEERAEIPFRPVTKQYILHIKFLNINLNRDDVEETNELIKRYSGAFAQNLKHFYYPVKQDLKYTNDVFIRGEDLDHNQLKKLKTILADFPIEGKTVFFAYHKIDGN